MEMIELKSAWDVLRQEVISRDQVKQERIGLSIHSQSKSEISQIKRGLHLKFILASMAIVGAVALAIVAVFNPHANPLSFVFSANESVLFFVIMALSLVVMLYFNFQAYKQIKAIQTSSLNLKDNLSIFISAMKRAVAVNVLSDTLITPIIFTWLYYAYAFEQHALGVDVRTILLFCLPITISFLSYRLQKYVQELKFGKYLSRLNGYLESLQNK